MNGNDVIKMVLFPIYSIFIYGYFLEMNKVKLLTEIR